MRKVIALLAVGNSTYGYWAYQLAASLKKFSDVSIVLACDKNISADMVGKTSFFDAVQILPEQAYIVENDKKPGLFKVSPSWAKLNLNKHIQAKEVVYLDCDAIALRDVSGLFAQKGYFNTQLVGTSPKMEGIWGDMIWAKMDVIWEKYGLADDAILPATNTSFMYWRDCEESQKLFELARKHYKETSHGDLHGRWGESKDKPDELFINVAMAQMGILPEGEPIYLNEKRPPSIEDIAKTHYLIGLYGGSTRYTHAQLGRYYDQLVRKYIGGNPYRYDQLMKQKFVNRAFKWEHRKVA